LWGSGTFEWNSGVLSRWGQDPVGPRTFSAPHGLYHAAFTGGARGRRRWRDWPASATLVLTCTGNLSRNRTVGVELGKGRNLAEIVGAMRTVAEGVKTTYAGVALARKHGVEMPITQQVHRLLEGQVSPREANVTG